MSIDTLLNKLNITKEYTRDSKGNYVIDIADSDEYGKFFSFLDKADMNDVVEYLDEFSSNVINSSNNVYKYEDQFLISLIGNWADDNYKCVIAEL